MWSWAERDRVSHVQLTPCNVEDHKRGLNVVALLHSVAFVWHGPGSYKFKQLLHK